MKRRHLLILVTIVALAAGLGAAVTWLATSGDDETRSGALGDPDANATSAGVIESCVDEQGALRIVDPAKECLVTEKSVNWLSLEKAGAHTLWVSPLASPRRGLFGCQTHGESGGLLTIWNGQCTNAHASEVTFPLALPDGWKIERVTVCYVTSNTRTFISGLGLKRVTMPRAPAGGYSDGTDLRSTTPECAESTPGSPVSIDGAMSLTLDLWFGARNDDIAIGAIALRLAPF